MKDWSKIEKELCKEDEEEDGGVDAFFQKIYKNATEDQRRAMMKSFQTSNGTVLSTNWDDVETAKYDPQTGRTVASGKAFEPQSGPEKK